MSRDYGYGGWAPYVPVAQRRRQAERKAAAMRKKGQALRPVQLHGRTIARSFWGKAWCDNLESYSDFENRLPRGRSYVRSGAVIDLRIEAGRLGALVSGSDLYRVAIEVDALGTGPWHAIVGECSGQVGSLIELLQGRLSQGVMERVARKDKGLFPSPRQMRFSCSCPDWASMCKHVAAALYGVGARLDDEPELLFRLRHVDAQDLIARAAAGSAAAVGQADAALAGADLSALFGIELAETAASPAGAKSPDVAQPAKPAARSAKPAERPARPPAAGEAAAAPRPRRQAVQPVQAAAPSPPATPPQATPPKAKPQKTSAPAAAPKTVSAAQLLARGIPRHMIQGWLAAGVLRRSSQRGVYRTTAQTEPRIRRYLAR